MFLGRVLQALVAIISIRFMTELLPQAEVGNQYLINSLILWFSLVLINPVGMFINRHLHEWRINQQLHYFVGQANRYFAFVAFITLPIVFIIRDYFEVGTMMKSFELLLFIALYVYLSTWFQTLVSFFNLFDFQKTFVSLNIFSQAIGLALAAAAVYFYEARAIVWMTGLLAGQAVALAIALKLFYKKFPPQQPKQTIDVGIGLFKKSTLLFCYPIAITTLFMWFSTQGYRLVVEKYLGAEVLASIGVGLGLATSIAGVVESITTQYFYPQYYSALPGSDMDQRRQAWLGLWKKTMIVYVPCCFLIISVSHLVVRLLTATLFHHVVTFVVMGAFVEFFRQSSNITYLVSQGEKKTHKTILPYLLGALCLVAMLVVQITTSSMQDKLIILGLLVAGLVTYISNLVTVRNMLRNEFEAGFILKAVAISLPLLLPFFILTVDTPLWLLIPTGVASGLWCLGCIYFLLKRTISQEKA